MTGRYRLEVHVDKPPAVVFDLWTDLDRVHEWIRGLTKVSDISGPLDRPGTTYISWFGSMASRTEVLEFDRPRLFHSRFKSPLLAGESRTTFAPDGDGTRLIQEFTVTGLVSRLAARIFGTGSYRGSFRGELNEFVRIAERDPA
jgi:uncharacterized protein YndB with AHSA1/START domain